MIIEPTLADYRNLGINPPDGKRIEQPTLQEVAELTGVDLSYGIPLVKKNLFGTAESPLYVPSTDDFARLGMARISQTYTIRDGVAFINDPQSSVVCTIAAALRPHVEQEGAVTVRMLGLPLEVTLFSPRVNDFGEKYGPTHTTRSADAVGTAFNGLDYSIRWRDL